jgi:hypothetical protein
MRRRPSTAMLFLVFPCIPISLWTPPPVSLLGQEHERLLEDVSFETWIGLKHCRLWSRSSSSWSACFYWMSAYVQLDIHPYSCEETSYLFWMMYPPLFQLAKYGIHSVLFISKSCLEFHWWIILT